jgi:abortive infection bacteriophage resistance protein
MQKLVFTKSAETSSQLIERLKARKLEIGDAGVAHAALSRIGYYRLSGYMRPFQTGHQPTPHQFKPGVSLQQVLALFEFDQRLRNLIWEAIEPIEVALRAELCNRMSQAHGPHWHFEARHFHPNVWADLRRKVANALEFDLANEKRKGSAKTGKNLFLDHYYDTYREPPIPPNWMLMELASFGLTASLFAGIASRHDRQIVASEFDFAGGGRMDESVLTSWVHGLSVLRNRCAHHSRIVYRHHLFQPKVPTKKIPAATLFRPDEKRLRSFFIVIALLSKTINPKSDWMGRLHRLFASTANVNLGATTGLAPDWESDPLWSLGR